MRSFKTLLILGVSLLCACAGSTDEQSDGDTDEPESTEGAWDAESADHEKDSTHLWIVNRGIDILAKHGSDEVAKKTVAIMNDAQCRKNWQQGLLDADFKGQYNNGNEDLPLNPSDIQVARAGTTWESHFFDPDTGKNYKGTPKTAYTEASSHVELALGQRLQEKTAKACYELGLALHYYTDLTQPMHASNFTAVNQPLKLHSNLEGYSMKIQARYPLADWSGQPTGKVNDWLLQTAKDSKPLFKAGALAIEQAYKDYSGWHILTCRKVGISDWRFLEKQHIDYTYCWAGNPKVDEMVGNTLKSAQDHTAKFLYLVGKQLPTSTSSTAGAP